MSSKKTGGHPARAGQAEDAREARRAKAAALRQRELARERSRRVLLISIAVVVVLALVAVVVVVIDRSRKDDVAAGTGTPPGVTAADGGYVLPGTPAAGAPTLDIWLDYQCPICKQFEDVSGTVYPQLAADGKAKVVVHTLSFLDDNLGNDASERAAEGAAAAAVQGKFVEYTQQVFANQPEQEGTGYTDDQLEQFAKDAGVADVATWRQQLDDHTWQGFVRRVQGAMDDQGVSGTPTVIVTAPDGTKKNISQTTQNGGDGSMGQLLGSNGAAFLTDAVAAATQTP
ncbi:thioredoxin domain-containing protein [Kineococcus endophyticus]|uniref:Thioredoxin domain-containing protein n=1 Tax=Kineococcus endophyticus TaxID=1181883 RepID=A0ABV3PBI2_9ACTN